MGPFFAALAGFFKNLPAIILFLTEVAKWVAAYKKKAELREIAQTMKQVKNAKTDEERAALEKKISDFWARVK